MHRLRPWEIPLLALAALPAAGCGSADGQTGPAVPAVSASVETRPVRSAGDAADDVCIWVHPADRALSLVIGTDKQRGLCVYDLDGKEIQELPDGRINNVDLRYGFPLDGGAVDLVAGTNRSNNSIVLYRIDPRTRRLHAVAARNIVAGVPVYGCCLYRSAATGKYFVIVAGYNGGVEQWELFDAGGAEIDARRVRAWQVGSVAEGCVADDELGRLYIGVERRGVFRFAAEPDAPADSVTVDTTGRGGRLTADVEGPAIYHAPGGRGYLLVSSQGSDDFVVYRREGDNAYVGRFRIVDGDGIDGVNDTDGIEVTAADLGPAFPRGVFIAQDGRNDDGRQNFKLVPWPRIAAAFSPGLTVDAGYDPRRRPAGR